MHINLYIRNSTASAPSVRYVLRSPTPHARILCGVWKEAKQVEFKKLKMNIRPDAVTISLHTADKKQIDPLCTELAALAFRLEIAQVTLHLAKSPESRDFLASLLSLFELPWEGNIRDEEQWYTLGNHDAVALFTLAQTYLETILDP